MIELKQTPTEHAQLTPPASHYRKKTIVNVDVARKPTEATKQQHQEHCQQNINNTNTRRLSIDIITPS